MGGALKIKVNIPYFVAKRSGKRTYFYWQPKKDLRDAGWQLVGLSAVEAEAIAEAEAWNRKLAAWRGAGGGKTPLADSSEPASAAGFVTFSELVAAYEASDEFAGLAKRTRTDYARHLESLKEWAGADAPVASINARLVRDLHRALATRSPAGANYVIRVLRLLLNWGIRNQEGLAGVTNPAADPNLEELPVTARVWSPAAVDAIILAAEQLGRHSVALAVALGDWTGQRQGDILTWARPLKVRGEVVLAQQKTGARVALPIHKVEELVVRIDAELDRQDAWRTQLPADARPQTLIVSEGNHRPYQQRKFADWFEHARTAAAAAVVAARRERTAAPASLPPVVKEFEPAPGTSRRKKSRRTYRIPGGLAAVLDESLGDDLDDEVAAELAAIQFKHLRHTAVTRLAEAGCTTLEISAITGHSVETVNTILKRYLVYTRELAENAMAKRVAHRGGRRRPAEVVPFRARQGGGD
ncbi:MAG: hypothetical protein IPM60_01860 [Rhodospirillales bacterium]|nr:hypothetical protein [Rhodospirillales bacterium]